MINGPSPRFLFFLYHYPPSPGISPKRNFLISSEIIKKTGPAFVFTASKQNSKNQTESSVTINAIPTLDYRVFVKKKSKSGAITDNKKAGKWFQRSIKLLNTFPFSILAAEGGVIYLMKLITKGNKTIKENKITHLYSSFRPFADHFASYILKKMHPEVYWIADFRDLLVDPYFNYIYFNQIHQKLFKSIFKNADLITTVSNGLAEHLKQYNPNVVVVKNGILNVSTNNTSVPSSFFTMAYTGSMYMDKKNARPIFIALKELIEENKISTDKVKIIYAGKDAFYWSAMADAFKMSSMLDIRGVLSSDDAMSIQKEACINILLSISSDMLTGILTGKMIEYVEAGNPVLAIVKNQIDPELEQILEELNIGKSFSDQSSDSPGIKDFIYKEYQLWIQSGTNRKAVDLDVLKEKYSVEETMRTLYERIGLFCP